MSGAFQSRKAAQRVAPVVCEGMRAVRFIYWLSLLSFLGRVGASVGVTAIHSKSAGQLYPSFS